MSHETSSYEHYIFIYAFRLCCRIWNRRCIQSTIKKGKQGFRPLFGEMKTNHMILNKILWCPRQPWMPVLLLQHASQRDFRKLSDFVIPCYMLVLRVCVWNSGFWDFGLFVSWFVYIYLYLNLRVNCFLHVCSVYLILSLNYTWKSEHFWLSIFTRRLPICIPDVIPIGCYWVLLTSAARTWD
jgi:hypothetical protein